MANKNSPVPYPETVAQRFFGPPKPLNPELFDENEVMHEQIRQRFLDKANYFIEKTVKTIPGLEVDDIILNGSNATYLYHQYSDYDVKITVKNVNNPMFSQKSDNLIDFLKILANLFWEQTPSLYINNHATDIKLSSKNYEFMGQYSILKNQWIIKPDKDALKGLTFEALMAAYYRKLEEINKFMAQFEKIDGKYKLEDCKKMQEYYLNLLLGYTPDMIKEYLVFKILSSQRKVKILGRQAAWEFCQALSS